METNNDQMCQQERKPKLDGKQDNSILNEGFVYSEADANGKVVEEIDENSTLNDVCDSFDTNAESTSNASAVNDDTLENEALGHVPVCLGAESRDETVRNSSSVYKFNNIFRLSIQPFEQEQMQYRDNLKRALFQARERYYKNCKNKTFLVCSTKRTGTYVCDGQVHCFEHKELVQYWCENCRSSRCEKCLLYSKICVNHDITSLKVHMAITKTLQQQSVEKIGMSCLKTADLLLKYIHRDQAQIELRALAVKERIRQEFISFYQLLEDEEQNIIDRLDMTLQKYTTRNQLIEDGCGHLIRDEAELMSKTLDTLQIDDPYGTSVEDVSNLINTEWISLARKATELLGHLQKCPDIIDVTCSFDNLKQTVKTGLSEVSESVKLVPVSYTIFLDGDMVFAPMKVSDLFSYEINGQDHEMFTVMFDVEIRANRQLFQKVQLRHDDHIFNSKDKLYLLNGRSYRVHAVTDRTQPGKNVLIVTGHQPSYRQDSSKQQHYLMSIINDIRRKHFNRCEEIPSLQFNCSKSNEIFCQWVDSSMWLFSCTSFCKGFFDVSPEEMRALAYCCDRPTYSFFKLWIGMVV